MKGDTYTIVKGYKVYKGRDTNGKPIAEFSEPELYDWLRSVGLYSAEQAAQIIVKVDVVGSDVIDFP